MSFISKRKNLFFVQANTQCMTTGKHGLNARCHVEAGNETGIEFA